MDLKQFENRLNKLTEENNRCIKRVNLIGILHIIGLIVIIVFCFLFNNETRIIGTSVGCGLVISGIIWHVIEFIIFYKRTQKLLEQ